MEDIDNITSKISNINLEDKSVQIVEVTNDIEEKWKNHKYNACIKLIPLQDELLITEFRLYGKLKRVGKVVHDDELNTKGKKKRNTVIRFVPDDTVEWNKPNEWVYVFTINDRIVKIGGTRTSLKDRANSYLCGHHISARGRSNKCSITNAFVYNTFDFYLENGYDITMYGYPIQECKITIDIFDETVDVRAQVYHAFEAKCLQEYKKQNGKYPHLSDNADPNYK